MDLSTLEPYNPISIEAWKAAAAAGKAPTGVTLRKQYIPHSIKAEDDASSRKLTFTITTGSVDRDRDTLAVDGWLVENYMRNPVVLWAHNYRGLPVGKAESLIRTGGALKALTDFVPADVSAFAETVFRMLKAGFLNAVSVGFSPTKHAYNDERRGYDFLEQELLEFSVVPVPANPEALLDAKAAGIDLSPIKGWAEDFLDALEPGMWLPKGAALRALKIAGGEPVSVSVPAPTEKGAEEPSSTPEPDPAPFVFDHDSARAVVRSAISELAAAHVRRASGRLD